MVKKKKQSAIDLAKETTGVGVVTMAGVGIGTAMSNVPGMPHEVSALRGPGLAGLSLINVGQLGKVGMALPGLMGVESKKKKSGNKYLDKML